jgi:uncharacterized protein (TIGR02118 family)
MLSVNVVYANRIDATFDFEYYMAKHIPMVSQLLQTTIEVHRGVASADGSQPSIVCVARIAIRNLEEYQAGMAAHGQQIISDVANYTNIQPMVQIDELVVQKEGRP